MDGDEARGKKNGRCHGLGDAMAANEEQLCVSRRNFSSPARVAKGQTKRFGAAPMGVFDRRSMGRDEQAKKNQVNVLDCGETQRLMRGRNAANETEIGRFAPRASPAYSFGAAGSQP